MPNYSHPGCRGGSSLLPVSVMFLHEYESYRTIKLYTKSCDVLCILRKIRATIIKVQLAVLEIAKNIDRATLRFIVLHGPMIRVLYVSPGLCCSPHCCGRARCNYGTARMRGGQCAALPGAGTRRRAGGTITITLFKPSTLISWP